MNTSGEHKWSRSSGTTETCVVCGCIGYHEDQRGSPSWECGVAVRYARWVNGSWVGYTTEATVEAPPCVPERGPWPKVPKATTVVATFAS